MINRKVAGAETVKLEGRAVYQRCGVALWRKLELARANDSPLRLNLSFAPSTFHPPLNTL
jgi:hypothetical protein